MDENKAEVLREIDYSIAGCGVCKWAWFPSPCSPWGECAVNHYDHKKHTGTHRRLSIHACGICPKFQVDTTNLHGFVEFVRKET